LVNVKRIFDTLLIAAEAARTSRPPLRILTQMTWKIRTSTFTLERTSSTFGKKQLTNFLSSTVGSTEVGLELQSPLVGTSSGAGCHANRLIREFR
jgi:hypothetical protein